jgi:hypothetical protein
MISEVDDSNSGLIRFSDFLGIYWKHKYSNMEGIIYITIIILKNYIRSIDDDQDTIDAFVAMGG